MVVKYRAMKRIKWLIWGVLVCFCCETYFLPSVDAQDDKPAVLELGEDGPGVPGPAPKVHRAGIKGAGLEPAVVIQAQGEIGAFFREYVFSRIEIAREKQAKLIIIQIDSPGGRAMESLEVANYLQSIDWAKTVAYIPREALSGAAFVALACDEIVMHPNARLGDAGAIFLDEFGMFQFADQKIVSNIATELRHIAEKKGRPGALAEAMVDKNLEVFLVRNRETQEERFLSDAELKSLPDAKQWEKGPLVLESQKERFLEVIGQRAVDLRLASAIVRDAAELKDYLGLKKMPVVLKYTWVDTFVVILNWWPITVLLFVFGLLCLYLELSAPGIGLPGITAMLCFMLFFWSRFLGGTADWFEVLLFLAGIICVGLEVFVTTGTLVAGLTGFLLILASLVMASQSQWIPSSRVEYQELAVNLGSILGAGVVFMFLVAVLGRNVRSLPVFNRVMLQPPDTSAMETQSAPSQQLGLALGSRGKAHTALRPSGKALFSGQIIEVVADGSIIPPGHAVEVVELKGMVIVVREVGTS